MNKFTITKLGESNGNYSLTKPQISGTNVVWYSRKKNEYSIFLYDGNKTIEIYSADVDTTLSPRVTTPYIDISENYVVWSGVDSHGKQQIFLYDGQEKIKITDRHNNNKPILFPQISGNNVVWNDSVIYFLENVVFSSEILLDNGKDIIKLTNDEEVKTPPKLSGNNIVWSGIDSERRKQIFLYNGKKVIQLTENKIDSYSQVKVTKEKEIEQGKSFSRNRETFLNSQDRAVRLTRTYNPLFGDDNISKKRDDADDYIPQISGDNIIWETQGNLFLYNGEKVIQIDDKNRDVNGFSIKISGGNIAWTADNTNGDSEIFLYNGKETLQLTDRDVNNISFQISGKNIVWSGTDPDGDSEIFLYNGKETLQLTDNDVVNEYPQISGNNIVWQSNFNLFAYNGSEVIQLAKSFNSRVLNLSPAIDGNITVWQKIDLENNIDSVMLATIDDTQSSSIPPVDRTPQIITTSAIGREANTCGQVLCLGQFSA